MRVSYRDQRNVFCSCEQPKSLVLRRVRHFVILSGGLHAVPIVKLSLLGREQHRFFSFYICLASLCPIDASANNHAGPKLKPGTDYCSDDAKLGPDASTDAAADASTDAAADVSTDAETKLGSDSNTDHSSEVLLAHDWLVREEHFEPGGMPIGVGSPWPGFVHFHILGFVLSAWLFPVLWFSLLQLR